MQLDMLYSTYGDRALNLIKNIPQANNNVNIIIIHQNANSKTKKELLDFINTRNDITYHEIDSIGVAKSRNYALQNTKGDIALFCDDDVVYSNSLYDDICNSYIKNPNAGFITFAYSDIESGNMLPKFKKNQYIHNNYTILSLGTIQISCKSEYISKYNFKFPEDMGAGTDNFLCDEPVFISNFLKKNILGIYIPISICMHPIESSGSIFNDKKAFNSRLMCFIRVFGRKKGIMIYMIFIFKNVRKFNSLYSFTTALKLPLTLFKL